MSQEKPQYSHSTSSESSSSSFSSLSKKYTHFRYRCLFSRSTKTSRQTKLTLPSSASETGVPAVAAASSTYFGFFVTTILCFGCDFPIVFVRAEYAFGDIGRQRTLIVNWEGAVMFREEDNCFTFVVVAPTGNDNELSSDYFRHIGIGYHRHCYIYGRCVFLRAEVITTIRRGQSNLSNWCIFDRYNAASIRGRW